MESFLGVLMLKTTFPRLPGDIGHPETFDFPVKRVIVKGADSLSVVLNGAEGLLQPFINSARELEAQGAAVITTSCGFLAKFQRQLAACVDIPVVSSSLLQLPLLHSIIAPRKRVGILTARRASLTEEQLECCGGKYVPHTVLGMEGTHFYSIYVDNETQLDVAAARADIINAASRMAADTPDLGAIVLECTNMSPFAKEAAVAAGVPVFDICTFVRYVFASSAEKDIFSQDNVDIGQNIE